MIERHPHVFGQEEQRSQTLHSEAGNYYKTLKLVKRTKNLWLLWTELKKALPALMSSEKLIKIIKRAGYELVQPEHLLERFRINFSPANDKDQQSMRIKFHAQTILFILCSPSKC